MQLFLQRCDIQNFQVYNHENPKALKYYVLSTFNTGVISVLVATPHIFEDMSTQFHERGKQKKDAYTFKNLDNIIALDLDPSGVEFAQ